MKSVGKKALSLILSLMMVISVIGVGVGSITASATVYASDVVSYARQYLGYPYVYGGKGPNSFDCSGFVSYVFKHFGISVPAGTAAWNSSPSSYGTIISTSTMKPGDVLLWSGHIGIYSGNDKCINAANSNDGVCEKPWVYYGSSPTVIRVYGVDYGNPPPADTTAPTISNLRISERNINGYKVECNVSDNIGVVRVAFPTWTTANGQDDLIWHEGTVSNGKASVWINRSEHKNEFGTYITDAYVYDAAGNYISDRISTNAVNDTTGPKISHIKVTDVTSTGYTISCTVTDNVGVSSVKFPTWTSSNGQDDIASPWPSGSLSGSTATYRVKYSEHNNESGLYITDLYAYDNYGNLTTYKSIQVYPSRINNISEGKYVFQSALDSNKVIDVADPITEDASNVQLWDYTGDSSQIFEITKNGAGYILTPLCSDYNIDAWGAVIDDDINIAQTNVNNDINQTWQFNSKGSGYYAITSLMGKEGVEYVMDVAYKKTENGTNIGLNSANGGDNQQFKLLPVYTVSYNANGGSGKPTSQYKVSTKTLKLSTTKPTRSGYTFLGWSTSSSDTAATYSAGANYTANSGATLYAVWEKTSITPIIYTLTYNANGGTGVPASQTGNGTITLSGTKPARDGYTFLGWATSATATSAQYQPGASFVLNANKTLYAVWKKIDTPINPAKPTASATLNLKSSASVAYRSDVTITATANNVPSGYFLAIYDGNTLLAKGDNSSVSYHAGEMRNSKTFTVKVVDSNGAVQSNSSGALQKDININVSSGFFAKIIAFFKALFGLLPKVEIKP